MLIWAFGPPTQPTPWSRDAALSFVESMQNHTGYTAWPGPGSMSIIYIYTHFCMFEIYIIVGNGISPPAFCDISKSHELRQFRVKGLGYMSLGFRLPNFPIPQIRLGHLGWDYLGNWEIGKYVPVVISQFPNFPNRAGPSGLGSFGKLGNWEVCTSTDFPIPQFPK